VLVTVLSFGGMSQPLLADIQTAEMNKSSADPTIKKIIAETISLLEKDLENIQKQKQKQEALNPNDRKVQSKIRKLDSAISTVRRYLSSIKMEIIPLIEKKDYTKAKSKISPIATNSSNKYITTGLTEKVILVVNLLDDIKNAQIKQVQNEFDQFHRDLIKTLLNAEQIEEIDNILVNLAALKTKCTYHDGSIKDYYKISRQIDKTTTIVIGWQNYLRCIANKDASGALSRMRTISSNVIEHPIVPRSEVLKILANVERNIAKLSGKESIEAPETLNLETILSRYTKADDLVKVIAETAKIKTHGSSSERNQAFDLLKQAQFLHNAHQQAIKGQRSTLVATLRARLTTSNHHEWRKTILLEIKMLSFVNMIPTEHQAEMREKSPIQQTEFIAAKLQKEKKWSELWELLNFTKQLLNSQPNISTTRTIFWFENDISSLSSFLAAQRYEEAGELAKALLLYREVLEKNGRYGPYKDTQKAIKNIRENKAEALMKNELEEASLLKANISNISTYDMRNFKENDSLIKYAVEKAVNNRMTLHLKAIEREKSTSSPAADKKSVTKEKKKINKDKAPQR